VVATGDVMLGRSVHTRALTIGDPRYPFVETHRLLSSADITIVNLENPLLDPCPATDVGLTFCAPTIAVEGLVFSGVDVVNLANNHTRNYGTNGYESTKTVLRSHGILPSDTTDLAVIERNGHRFGFLGFDIVTSWPDESLLLARVQEADQRVDVLVVSVHRGTEYVDEPSARERALLRSVVDAGADVVIGHHPHVIQPVEEYRGALIVYSLGNFVFGGHSQPADMDSMIYQATFARRDGRVVPTGSAIVPVRISSVPHRNDFRPVLLEGSDRERVLARVAKASEEIRRRR
jgi:poly-gamma-glutamate synthesis protein (capsule biosynthesis protein)